MELQNLADTAGKRRDREMTPTMLSDKRSLLFAVLGNQRFPSVNFFLQEEQNVLQTRTRKGKGRMTSNSQERIQSHK